VSGGIGQTKRHHQILIKTVSGGEGSLWDIFFMDLDLMIARTKVNLRKDLCSNQLIEQEINVGQWILVLDGYCIEWLIIDAQSLGLVLLRQIAGNSWVRYTLYLAILAAGFSILPSYLVS
jgi:hydrogenase maturation factor